MTETREPHPALRPFVSRVWASAGSAFQPRGRERVLPTGAMHLAIRVSGEPLRVFDGSADRRGTALGAAVVGGARDVPYIRAVSPVTSVGAQLRPGAAQLLFGVPAVELADRHTPLDALWSSPAVERLHDQLAEARTADARLRWLEATLLARLPSLRGLHPAVAHALRRFQQSDDVGDVVAQTGYSHRRFIELFKRAVGLGPKRYCGVMRFQRALDLMSRADTRSLSQTALSAGYADQPHFAREFRRLAGQTATSYRSQSPAARHHVPLSRTS